VAVLAVDPSSTISGGSILGDKTRMENLSRHENAFIRPSPSGGNLGGVTRKSRETIILCEAAGFDVVFIETVGVGQSEVLVGSMVDFFLLLLVPGTGDELQGMKKGIVELADSVLINKADGDNIQRARIAAREYSNALKYLIAGTGEWVPPVLTCSALHGDGLDKVWDVVMDYVSKARSSGTFEQKRKKQDINWMFSMVEQQLMSSLYRIPIIDKLSKQVLNSEISSSQAAEYLLTEYFSNFS
jgi:LAO/AO transport system kinase